MSENAILKYLKKRQNEQMKKGDPQQIHSDVSMTSIKQYRH